MRYTVCLLDGQMEYNTDSLQSAMKEAITVLDYSKTEVLILDKKLNIKISIDKMKRM